MTAYVELYMDQGSTFNNIVNITDDLTNAYVNVYGYNVTSQLRRSYYSANASGNLTCTITDATNGEITLSMTAANTANMKAGRYLFDIKTVNPQNVTSKILEGIITVVPGVTR